MSDLEIAVRTASAKWKTAFNAGNFSTCAACYAEDAEMIAKPFGTFKGRKAIASFWEKLINDGFGNVEYIDPQIESVDDRSAILTSNWKMNNAYGVITRELWVLQSDGTALLYEDQFEALG